VGTGEESSGLKLRLVQSACGKTAQRAHLLSSEKTSCAARTKPACKKDLTGPNMKLPRGFAWGGGARQTKGTFGEKTNKKAHPPKTAPPPANHPHHHPPIGFWEHACGWFVGWFCFLFFCFGLFGLFFDLWWFLGCFVYGEGAPPILGAENNPKRLQALVGDLLRVCSFDWPKTGGMSPVGPEARVKGLCMPQASGRGGAGY